MATVSIESLTKRFGRVLAVDGLSFQAPPGTITGFLGPNGAGKTTTLRSALGLVRPTSGRVLIDQHRYQDLSQPRRVVGALLDPGATHPGRTGRDHLRVMAGVTGVGDSRVDALLEQVDLTEAADRRVSGYSLGMHQRLGLAVALMGDPEVLILDEPANGLDPEGIAWLRGLLRGLAAQGRTILISSHLLSEVSQTVDRVVIIDEGRLRFDGTLAELGSGTVSVRTAGGAKLRDALTRRGFQVAVTGTAALEVRGATADQVGQVAADERIGLSELTTDRASLEAAFLRLTGSSEIPAAPAPRRSPAASTSPATPAAN
jgi:ABC-2 type transport system ATP-binding protein